MANTKITTNVIADGAITSAKLDTNITISGTIVSGANNGVIKEIGSDFSIVQGAVGLRINDAASAISPTTASANNDNAVDLGVSNIRFKDIYLSGKLTNDGSGGISVDISGNVGIGTDSPSYSLDIAGERARISGGTTTTFAGFEAENSNGFGTIFGMGGSGRSDLLDNRGFVSAQSATSGLTLGTEGADPIIFYTNGTSSERMRILSGGGIYMQSGYQFGWGSTANSIAGSTSTNALAFYTNSSERMKIDSNGQLLLGTTTSDSLLSVDIQNTSASSNNTLVRIKNTIGSEDAGLIIDGNNSGQHEYRIGVNTVANTSDLTFSGGTGYRFYTGSNERMRIDSSGNLLVGTTSLTPNYDGGIRVHSASNVSNIRVSSGDKTGFDMMQDTGGTGYLVVRDNAGMTFHTNNAERMRIDSSGKLLIGVTSFGNSGGGTEIRGGLMKSSATTTSTHTHNFFTSPNGAVGSIQTNGSATQFNTASDGRLKDIIGSARGLEVINELNPVSYNWKADGKADEGLIAQEVQEIVPNAVSGSEEEMYQMDYSKLVVHLVAGMKEQQTQIEALQSEINLLKGE